VEIDVGDRNTTRIQQFGYRKPRFRVEFHFLVQVEGRGSKLLDARCIDLSEDGLSAQISDCLEVGTHVTFILTLPGATTSARLAALVNYRQAECHGFTFVFSSQEERDFVHRYLATLHSEAISFKPPKG
jgi:hypothetical protein